MNEEGSLFDVPPAAIGRYRVRQPLGAGTTGPAFHAETPGTLESVAIKLFKVDLSPVAAHELAQSLTLLIDQTPEHDALVVPLDAGLDEIEAYFVTRLVDGTSLDAALRDFGPAAIEDLVPRLKSLAGALDAAHHVGLVHGALHPRDILVSPEETHVTGLGVAPALACAGAPSSIRRPYGAPELADGEGVPTGESDQFSLAAIAFEWMFGRRISGPAERPIEVRALPGVDREALADAFTTALAPEPDARFETCAAFCNAIESAMSGDALVVVDDPSEDVEEAFPLHPALPVAGSLLYEPEDSPLHEPEEDEFPLEETPARSSEREHDAAPRFESPPPAPPSRPSERFGGGVLIATLLVGLGVGFAAGYMAKPRALQNPPLAGSTPPAEPSAPVETESPVAEPAAGAGTSTAPVPEPARVAPAAPTGSLLVRSTPPGASVIIDGVPRGETPLALRDLELKSWNVLVAQRGFVPDERRVALTRARPSRSFEVRLTPEAAAVPAPPAAGAAVATGTLLVESRPSGAVVTINGESRGTTPLALDKLAPGEYDVRLALRGYRPFSTRVRVVSGERARAAASLSPQERE